MGSNLHCHLKLVSLLNFLNYSECQYVHTENGNGNIYLTGMLQGLEMLCVIYLAQLLSTFLNKWHVLLGLLCH